MWTEKTKVMSSIPSIPKQQLKKCNVKKKNKCHEKILIEKLKELTLSIKKWKMQEGHFGVFHGTSRYKRGGGAMFGMLDKSARSILPWVGKKYWKP